MTVINSTTDANELMLTVVAEFEAEPGAGLGRVGGPRKLERWWGPPTYPATFARHEFHVGGQSPLLHDRPDRRYSRTAGGVSTRSTSRAGSSSSTGSPATTASR